MLSSNSLMAHINSCALALPWKGLEGPAETPGPSSLLPLLPRPLMARYVCFLVPGACAKMATERVVVSIKTKVMFGLFGWPWDCQKQNCSTPSAFDLFEVLPQMVPHPADVAETARSARKPTPALDALRALLARPRYGLPPRSGPCSLLGLLLLTPPPSGPSQPAQQEAPQGAKRGQSPWTSHGLCYHDLFELELKVLQQRTAVPLRTITIVDQTSISNWVPF